LCNLRPRNEDAETAASADAGTWIEVGWFLGKGKPMLGYSNTPENFVSRKRRQLSAKHADPGIEGFHLPDDLMIVGTVHSGGYLIFLPTHSKAWPRCARRVRDPPEGGGTIFCQATMNT
jgi:nucleoside 2-deoxyribosyltransferase